MAGTDDDARLAAYVSADRWRLPAPLPPDLAALEAWGAEAAAAAFAARPDAVEAALAALDRIGAESPPDRALRAMLPRELNPAYNLRARPVDAAWHGRSLAVARLVAALEARADDGVRGRMIERIERLASVPVRGALCASLLGWRAVGTGGRAARADAVAPRAWLERIASHLERGDPLLPWAAEAGLLLDGAAARARVAAIAASLEGEAREDLLGALADGLPARVDLDADPAWIDLWAPILRAAGHRRSALAPRICECRTIAPVLRALRVAGDEALFSDLLDALHRIDDPAAAAELESIATSLPSAPAKPRAARSRESVADLVKRLRRARKGAPARASLTIAAGVGTDGGPVLVLPSAAAADRWGGAPADPAGGDPSRGPGDYARACAAAGEGEGRGLLDVGGEAALALEDPQVQVALLEDGAVLIGAGSDLDVARALEEKGAFKSRKERLEVGPGGLVLLDAAFTVARAPEGALARVALAAGSYDLSAASLETAAGPVHAVRLRRVEAKARPAAAKAPGAAKPAKATNAAKAKSARRKA